MYVSSLRPHKLSLAIFRALPIVWVFFVNSSLYVPVYVKGLAVVLAQHGLVLAKGTLGSTLRTWVLARSKVEGC